MSKYIALLNWTEQGIKSVKDSAKRYEAAKELAKGAGCTMEAIYMTFGPYDQVVVLDAPDDEAAALFDLRIASLGNIRMMTMKAFPEADYRRIVESV